MVMEWSPKIKKKRETLLSIFNYQFCESEFYQNTKTKLSSSFLSSFSFHFQIPMAELILSAVLPVLFEKLMAPELLKFATQEGVRSKLKKLEKTLKMIEALLFDAEEKQLRNGAVKNWLDELQDLAYDAEDILDEYATEALRRKLKVEEYRASTSRAWKLIPACCITPSALWSDFSMRSKIDDITSRLDYLCRQRTQLGLVEIDRGRSTASLKRPATTSSQIELAVFGRDEDKAKILEMVLTDKPGDANFGVISIVAMGGFGKTTLAREVYNDKTVKDFNPKAWICISDDFDVMRVSTAILESITGCASNLENLDAVQKQLKEKVAGSKFLFVLDDVWSEDYNKWELLRSPFMVGAHGSKFIVTTRHEGVASTMRPLNEIYKLMPLLEDDCWSLFKKHAFDSEVMGADPLIRQKVIERCKGVPLVAKTLGGLLRSNRRGKWLDILNSPLWQLQDESEISKALLLSYHHLPSHLKRCFAYCSILLKDYEFEEKELVFLWMAEGLIQQSGDNDQLEDLGGEYFRDLLSRSIFQVSSSNGSKYIMHDLINDLAQKVSGKLSFRLEDELDSNNRSNISEKTRYASYICHRYNHKRKFEVFNVAVHLRTHLSMPNELVTTSYVSHTVISDLLLRFKKLRVLSVQTHFIVALPDSIDGLRLLRYLNLSNSQIISLPESVNSMCNLQTLLLRNCCKFLKWPCSMGNLINLRHLDILGASLIKDMPVGVRKWERLRTLSNFIVGEGSGSNLKDLKHLKFLCGELHISKLKNMIVHEDTIEFILSGKEELKVLLLEWGSMSEESQDEEVESRDMKVDKRVLDMLRPHPNLEKLTIRNFGGTQLSTWVGDNSFSEMTVLELEDCKKCEILPSFGLLSSLKNLTIKGMKGIKGLGSEFYGNGPSEPFPSLETLCFTDLEDWEFWNPVKENESFPNLQELSIVRCPKLRERLPKNLSSLKKLVIRGCEQLVVSLSNIPKLCELELDECKKIVCSNSADFKSLKFVSLSKVSDFGDWPRQEFKKVESLKIKGCEELIELWQNEIFLEKPLQGLHSLTSLRELHFENCNNLTTLLQKNTHVEELRIEMCDSLSFIFRGQIPQSLKKLHVSSCEKFQCLLDDKEDNCTSLFLLPKEKINADTSHLVDLHISSCPSLKCLPSIDRLSTALTSLEIWNCSNLTTLSSTGHLPMALKHLKIDSCSELVDILPKGQLPETLEILHIQLCEKLESIVEEFHNNKALYSIYIIGCDNLKSLPEGLETLSSLRSIDMIYCRGFASFPKGGFPDSNLKVWLYGCEKLEALPSGIHTLSSFKELKIIECPNMSLSEDGLPTKLAELIIHGLKQYKPLMKWGLHNLTSLTYLDISGEPDGESLREEDMTITLLPRTLNQLVIKKFPKLKYLPFKDFKDLPSLEYLTIWNCPELTSLPSLPSSLLDLDIDDCPELTSLPSLPSSLLDLSIDDCRLLKEACKRDKGKEWSKIADIPRVTIDRKFIYDPEEASGN